jgi:hypothetical protein
VTRQERQQFLSVLRAHAQTVAIAEACASTTRDLAAEVARGATPSRNNLLTTISVAERVLEDLAGVRDEVERLLANFSGHQPDGGPDDPPLPRRNAGRPRADSLQ